MDITRRIPNNLGGTENLVDDFPLVGSIEFSDGLVAFGPAALSIFIVEQITPAAISGYGFVFSFLLGVAGLLSLIAKPNHFTLSEWIMKTIRYRRRNKEMKKELKNNSVEVSSNSDTRNKIGFERVYPKYNAIEKTNGSLVGIIQIDGSNLYNAPQSEIANRVSQYTNFLNTQVDEEFQLFLPMRQYDPTEKITRLEDRVESGELSNNDFLREYAEDRMLWLSLMAEQSYTRDYYAVVETNKSEVLSKHSVKQSGFERTLRSFGEIGDFLAAVWIGLTGGSVGRMSESEIKNRQVKEHQRKMEKMKNGLAQGVGSDTRVINGDELGVLFKEFWEGIDVRENEKENFIREKPYVMGETDREVAKREFQKWQEEQAQQKEGFKNKKRW